MNKTEYDDIKANLIKKSLEKDKKDVYPPVERRKGEDGRLSFIKLMSLLVWAIVLIMLGFVVKAGKSFSYIKQNNMFFANSDLWNVELLRIAMRINIVCFIVCGIVIGLNFTRNKRRNDRIKKSLIFCKLVCFVVMLFLFLKLY